MIQKSSQVASAALELLWAAICSTVDRSPDKCQSLLEALTDALEKHHAKPYRAGHAKRCVGLIRDAAQGWHEHGAGWRGASQAHLTLIPTLTPTPTPTQMAWGLPGAPGIPPLAGSARLLA